MRQRELCHACDLTATAAFLNAHTCMHFMAAQKNVYGNDWASGDIFKRFRGMCVLRVFSPNNDPSFIYKDKSRTIFSPTLLPQVSKEYLFYFTMAAAFLNC